MTHGRVSGDIVVIAKSSPKNPPSLGLNSFGPLMDCCGLMLAPIM